MWRGIVPVYWPATMRGKARGTCCVIATLAVFVGAAPAVAQSPVPPSLTGEEFTVVHNASLDTDGTVDMQTTCAPTGSGEESQTTFTVTGVAFGPYPGPFEV